MGKVEHVVRPVSKSLFLQLFLFPLLLVLVGVLVWVLFIASAQDNRTVEELLEDIESGSVHARHQDAFTLARMVGEASKSGGDTPFFSDAVTRKIIAFLERVKDDQELTKYFTLALGRAGSPELTVPVLERIALEEGGSSEARSFAAQGLVLSRSAKAVEPLQGIVDRYGDAADWELRWYALAGLVNIGHGNKAVGAEAAVPYLRRALLDPRR